MANPPSPTRLKLVLVGDSGVGKTSIFNLFDKQEVTRLTETTIGITMRIKSMVTSGLGHITVEVQVFDTAGEERHRSVMRQFYRNTDIAVFVYDITESDSYHNIARYWKNDMLKSCENNQIKMILIGNKTDEERKREVERYIAEDYAEKNNMMFTEMSAYNEEHFSILYDVIKTSVGLVMNDGGSCKYRSSLADGHNNSEVVAVNDEPPPDQPQQQTGWCSSC